MEEVDGRWQWVGRSYAKSSRLICAFPTSRVIRRIYGHQIDWKLGAIAGDDTPSPRSNIPPSDYGCESGQSISLANGRISSGMGRLAEICV